MAAPARYTENQGEMSSRLSKPEVKEMLLNRDHEALLKWASESRNPQRILLSFAFDQDDLIRWRAIEAVGKVAAIQAKSDLKKVRDLIRRLLWQMNDESGALGWHAPELIGEILVNVPELVEEYAKLLPSFLTEKPFERGTHIAMCRVASDFPELFSRHTAKLGKSLSDSDPAIRGYASLVLGVIGAETFSDSIAELTGDSGKVAVYDHDVGQLMFTTVGRMATEAIRRLENAGNTTREARK